MGTWSLAYGQVTQSSNAISRYINAYRAVRPIKVFHKHVGRRTEAYYVRKCCANQGQKAHFYYRQRARQQKIRKLHPVMRMTRIPQGRGL